MKYTYLILSVGVLIVIASAPVAGAESGIEELQEVNQIDGDSNGVPSRVTITVTVDTNCKGCYDDGFLDDPKVDPKIRITAGNNSEILTDIPRADDHTITHRVRGADILDTTGNVSIKVTVLDDDSIGEDIIDQQEITVEMEPLEDDETDPDTLAFAYTLNNLERCGTFCGEATAVLRNTGSQNRSNISVTVTALTGETVLRRDTHTVERLAPEKTDRVRQRVELSPLEALQVKRNDMQVTIQIVTTYDDGDEVVVNQVQ